MSIQILFTLILQLFFTLTCFVFLGRAGFLGGVFGAVVFLVLIGAGAFK